MRLSFIQCQTELGQLIIQNKSQQIDINHEASSNKMIQKKFMTKICGLKSNFCDDHSLSKQKVWLKKKIF